MGRKKKRKIDISDLHYRQADKELLLNFMHSYKSEDFYPPLDKNFNRHRDCKKFMANAERRIDEQLRLSQKAVTNNFTVTVLNLYYKYYTSKKILGADKPFFNADIERKLDMLADCVATIDSNSFYIQCKRLDNPDCVVLKDFLVPSMLVPYLKTGIGGILSVDAYAYSLNCIERALSNRFDMSNMQHRKRRMFYIHVGKTNSGKTYGSLQMLKKAKSGAYLSPLRLLALEVSDNLNSQGIPCSFVTGEEERRVENATHIASTVELADYGAEYDVAVIDECQMIADNSRGYAWTKAIMSINAREVCLCTAPEALDVLVKLIDACGDFYQINQHRRKTPLVVEDTPFTLDDVQTGDALVVFSKQKVNAIGAQLIKKGINVSVLYGALPYEARKKQFENFVNGVSDVLVTTDAIGMGVNLPVRRVIFMEIYKFDGRLNRTLRTGEIKQIAGRAGRRGIFNTGYVNALGQKELEYIRKNLVRKTEKVNGICVSFPKRTLNDEHIDLRNAMRAWKFYSVPDIYVKEDLTEAQRNVAMVSRLYKKLGVAENKTEIFEIATMPVDSGNILVRHLWFDYIEQRLSGNDTLRKPYLKNKSVDEVLAFSKMLDTYFMCGRIWGMKTDLVWLEKKRKECNKLLIEGLIDDVGNYTRHCTKCGKLLDWDIKGSLCSDCSLL